jgi:uroporphyrin-III C-methyltransferase/precorrin-2 dehydrogenase/sirohydrochlorin ferrochelatase
MSHGPLLPLFVKLAGRDVLLVGGGAMAATRVVQLAEAGARVTVVAPEVRDEVARRAAVVHRRPFAASDLDGAWLAIAAATPDVNAAVAAAAEERRILVNAVDDPERATAYTAGVVRRGDATVAVSTGGRAPAVAGLLREAIDAMLPEELDRWVDVAEAERPRWKRAGVPMTARRPLLLQRLNELYAERAARNTPRRGFVSLVGAGPGDPGLLTRAGADRLARADVVFYDALVDERVLELAPKAQRFFVGKRAGNASVSQRAIERLLVRAARRGRRVVRLKCGDPFVFGRGGEECDALAAAGIPFEVIPGVSSAISAPALAGIPVTHRGLSTGFAVVAGHAGSASGALLDAITPGAMTLVVLMGVAQRARTADHLLTRGWAAETPAAIVLGASAPGAFTWRGTLGGIGAAELPADRLHLPGILVVGAVAALDHSGAAPEPALDVTHA